jgi:hypothetical protein
MRKYNSSPIGFRATMRITHMILSLPLKSLVVISIKATIVSATKPIRIKAMKAITSNSGPAGEEKRMTISLKFYIEI